jgi:hypothetical protein
LKVENLGYNVEKCQRHEEIHKDLVSIRVFKNFILYIFLRDNMKKTRRH